MALLSAQKSFLTDERWLGRWARMRFSPTKGAFIP